MENMFNETPTEAWQMRYGYENNSLPELDGFLNHRSVRHFSSDPVSESTLEGLIAAAQSASTSSNLQLWSVLSVEDPQLRELVARECSNQKQILTAPVFLAFFADHYRLRIAAQGLGIYPSGLDLTEFFTMAVIDAALAAERLVCAAEHLGLGACYIGALRNNPEAIKGLLGLPEGVFGVFGLCIGHPADKARSHVKPRLDQPSVFFRNQYGGDFNFADYDARMKRFYEEQGLKMDAWTQKSSERVASFDHQGRENQLQWLQANGFLKK
jgi:nitroreductase